jgi:hypothetical protein
LQELIVERRRDTQRDSQIFFLSWLCWAICSAREEDDDNNNKLQTASRVKYHSLLSFSSAIQKKNSGSVEIFFAMGFACCDSCNYMFAIK